MKKRSYVELERLVDITYEGETEESRARWLRNLEVSGVMEGYALGENTKKLSDAEIEYVDLDCYNFMGSACEDERFYGADWTTVRERATGKFYALETDDIWEF